MPWWNNLIITFRCLFRYLQRDVKL
jgi:hypothetical protein